MASTANPTTSTIEQPHTSRSSMSSQKIEKEPVLNTTTANEYADAEENYDPKSLKFWLIILSVYLSFFLVALNRIIIVTAIPAITNTFSSIKDIR
jgi:hypothetical protein